MKKPKAIQIYIAFTALLAVVVASFVDWSSLLLMPPEHKWGFLVLVGVGLFSEHQSVRTVLGDGRGAHTITFIPLSTSVVLFGPAAPVMFMALVGPVAEFLFRRKPAGRATFNTAQYVIATSGAGWAYGALDGIPLALSTGWEWQGILLPFVVFGLTLLLLNQAFVSFAISLSQGIRFREVIQKMAGPTGATALYDLAISPVSLIVAFLYIVAGGWPGLLLAIFPLLFIRNAYLLNFKLQEANRSLLRALVKAIETRDPYTSGHSLRVQALAGRIVRQMGLPEVRKKNIEQAALLHDIGKIDAIYTDILKKPETLSESERQVIESHVTKGVELLTSISSFPTEVIDSVRYHHEREDGKGYPHGLMGEDIPLGAKIINVCDAVDAMLSDRPYRSALSTDAVKRELIRYRGVQFDSTVVDVLIETDLLDEHAEQVRFENQIQKQTMEGLRTSAIGEARQQSASAQRSRQVRD